MRAVRTWLLYGALGVLCGAAVILPHTALSPALARFAHALVAPQSRVLFLGDMMFDRQIRQMADEHGGYQYIVEGLEPLFFGHDLIAFNLEGPVTDNPSQSEGSPVGSPANYVFTFPPQAVDTLGAMGRFVADLGNNHSDNFGSVGLAQTAHYLAGAHIAYFGLPGQEDDRMYEAHLPGGVLALVSYNQFRPSEDAEASSTLAAIRAARAQGDAVVVFAHWGEEYTSAPTALQRMRAQEFAAAGASLIVGAHPHTVIAPEVLNGTPVYYSLGNAVFDQYFSGGVRCGEALSVTLEDGALAGFSTSTVYLLRSGQSVLSAPHAAYCDS